MYHVLSRGDRRQAIFVDDTDRQTLLETLGQACGRTGWRVHAYVLMSNHYHLLVETPGANLVAGMKWFQGTYTQRFNRRHRQCGHLFQGRYKALVVESGHGPYFSIVGAYIHLNPARAHLFDLRRGRLEDYAWSSYPGYLKPDRRASWLSVAQILADHGFEDDRKGRLGYRRYLNERVGGIASSKEGTQMDATWARIRRGWCLGSESFVDSLLSRLDSIRSGRSAGSLGGDAIEEHNERQAKHLCEVGMTRMGLSLHQFRTLAKGAVEKRVLAWYVRRRTMVPNGWLAAYLNCGHPANIPGYIRSVETARDRQIKELKTRILQSED